MKISDIAYIRLAHQQIAGTKFKTPNDIVRWMGAMQAQDYNMAKWAVGVRLPGSTDEVIESAFNKGEIIRTHVLRPTWHFVASEDIYWMLSLTGPRIKSFLKSRQIEMGLTDKILTKSNAVLEETLKSGNHLTRDELLKELSKAKIKIDTYRSIHLLLNAELDGLVCSGEIKGNRQTYALLEKRIPKKNKISREEALSKLVFNYFTSHAPATLQDFTWWSGLSVADARSGLEMIQSRFVSETIGEKTYWLPDSFALPQTKSVFLLPAFDEFLISYRDRTAALTFENHKRSISENGIFRPVIVVNGQVTGLWKRSIKKDKVVVETEFFKPQTKGIRKMVEQVTETFGKFLNRKVVVIHSVY